jgi:hypothetical protein
MKIDYVMLTGGGIDPAQKIMDTITWDDLDAPTYDTGRVKPLVEAFVAIYGAAHARDILAGGWSNGYTSTRIT